MRFSRYTPDTRDEGSAGLLDQLLQQPVPDENQPLRPVTLRSQTEQRRHALRAFLLRTWFDLVLKHTERLLLIALVSFFAFWFVDVYVRDWLHARQTQTATLPTPALPDQPDTIALLPERVAEVSANTFALGAPLRKLHEEPTLPFVSTAMSTSPSGTAANQVTDYLAPRAMDVPPRLADPRPQRLLMPNIEIDTPVQEVFIENGVWQVADYAVGYHHGTALPGEGNTVMAGHAGIRGAVFRDIGALAPGDIVLVDAGDWRYHYEVRATLSVWPTQIEVMQPTATPVLTLITCTDWDTRRLVVIADLVDSYPL